MKNKFKRGDFVVALVDIKPRYDFEKTITVGTKGQISKRRRTGNRPLLVNFNGVYSYVSEDQIKFDGGFVKNNVKNNITVGQILVSSWGYDQTNVTFYQVVAKISDLTVKIRKINGEILKYENMSGNTRAVKNDFIGDEMTKRINYSQNGDPYIRISSYACAFPDRDGSIHCFSDWH